MLCDRFEARTGLQGILLVRLFLLRAIWFGRDCEPGLVDRRIGAPLVWCFDLMEGIMNGFRTCHF